MKKLMILGAGIYQVPLIKKAQDMGLHVIVAGWKGNYPGFDIADTVYYADIKGEEKILDIAKSENIDGICTLGSDVGVASMGKVVSELGLNGISYQSGLYSSNKAMMKEAFLSTGVRTAKHWIVKDSKEAYSIYHKSEKPLLFKATDNSGSRGIIFVDNTNMVDFAIKEVMKNTCNDYFIIEEFVEGIEFGAQAFMNNGKMEFILPHGDVLHTADAPCPVGHYMPYHLKKELNLDIEDQVLKSIKALRLDNCTINADFILREDKVYVLEIGARAGGACLADMVAIYYGIDYFEQIIKLALGEKPEFKYKNDSPVACKILISEEDCKIVNIQNNNLPNKNILDIVLDYGTGDILHKFKVGSDRIGHIIARGPDLEKTFSILDEAARNIIIKTEQI